jgi:signal peptidase II
VSDPEISPAGLAATPPTRVRPPSVSHLVLVAGFAAAFDLLTKHWATRRLAPPDFKGERGTVIVFEDLGGFLSFDFIFAQNPVGAFSMMRSLPEIVRRPFFLYVSAAAAVFLVSMYLKVDRRQTALVWGLPLALGGAIGNLVDRMRYGWVVDFIHLWIKRGDREHHWPTFNVADIAIVAGVILLAIDLFWGRRADVAPEPERS